MKKAKVEIGSFSYVADPNDRSRCSEECEHYRQRVNAYHPEWCAMSVMHVPGERTGLCLYLEKHEAERPARWIECAPHEVPIVICSNCEESGKFSSYEACPNCGRRVVQDGEA